MIKANDKPFFLIKPDTPLHEVAKDWLRPCLQSGACVVDATVGNGNDTLFLYSETKPNGKVLAFDVQAKALEKARQKVPASDSEVIWIHQSHDTLGQHLDRLLIPLLDGAIFNLGYLPGADHKIKTKAESTVSCLNQILKRLKVGGRVSVVAYRGHPGGPEEESAIHDYLCTLDPEKFRVENSPRENSLTKPVFYGIIKMAAY